MMHGVGVLLLTAVAGYWVLERAATHKGELKKIGELVGGFIIVASLLGVACHAWMLVSGKSAYCPVDKMGKGWCPYTSKVPLDTPRSE